VPATVYQKEAAWLPVLRFFLRASASPREPVPALFRMATAKQCSAMATRTSPPRPLERPSLDSRLQFKLPPPSHAGSRTWDEGGSAPK
jgi:hypothetical protein